MATIARVAGLTRTLRPVVRREFLSLLALGAAGALAGCSSASKRPAAPVIPGPVPGPAHTVTRAPEPTHNIALTIDDGYDADVVAAYVKLATDTGLSLTFNPIGKLASTWEPHAAALAPLIERGQVQIGNHTFNHLLLPKLSDTQVAAEIEQNEQWIEKTFGVTARPYLRPPSGLHDSRVDAIAGGLGYTRILMWQSSFSDASPTTTDKLLTAARAALEPGAIIVGHANQPTVTGLYPQITELIRERKLQPKTLDQMFATSRKLGR